mmetsp:Transcript_26905/g.64213  ORF Transcript_26905/g.64213 Transcript_26905/m.64213 type:complete len:201 (-) Transcript_26905:244-846(-)
MGGTRRPHRRTPLLGAISQDPLPLRAPLRRRNKCHAPPREKGASPAVRHRTPVRTRLRRPAAPALEGSDTGGPGAEMPAVGDASLPEAHVRAVLRGVGGCAAARGQAADRPRRLSGGAGAPRAAPAHGGDQQHDRPRRRRQPSRARFRLPEPPPQPVTPTFHPPGAMPWSLAIRLTTRGRQGPTAFGKEPGEERKLPLID